MTKERVDTELGALFVLGDINHNKAHTTVMEWIEKLR